MIIVTVDEAVGGFLVRPAAFAREIGTSRNIPTLPLVTARNLVGGLPKHRRKFFLIRVIIPLRNFEKIEHCHPPQMLALAVLLFSS